MSAKKTASPRLNKLYDYWFLDRNRALMISYRTMRNCIGWFALLLPVVVAVGVFPQQGFRLLDSISGYYHSNMRDIFIGVLGCVALFLIAYKGYSRIDDVVTNLTGIFAAGVALFPAEPMTKSTVGIGVFCLPVVVCKYVHLGFAFLFFASLAYNAFFLFTRTDKGEKASARKKRRNRIYRACGIIMASVIVLCVVYYAFLQNTVVAAYQPVFFLEAIGLFTFGLSWLIKGKFFSRKKT